MQRLKILLLLASLLPLSNCVFANQDQDGDGTKDPILSGSVSDASSRKPVKGVTISITSKNEKKQVTTDALGQFIIPRLAAGEVTIILEKKGYKTYRKEKVVLKEGAPVKLKVDLSNLKDPEDGSLFQPLLRMMEG